jgi:hypothetical protein
MAQKIHALACNGRRRDETNPPTTVNRWVAGSSPARGAKFSDAAKHLDCAGNGGGNK